MLRFHATLQNFVRKLSVYALNDKNAVTYFVNFNSEFHAARLERKSFFAYTLSSSNLKSSCKKDWERKTEIAAQINTILFE
ncbi:MAG: hypothetical protein DI622_06300 [Chryseobacterium sp.]|nr:MAG: hypothetical protein DI622_06300 [Chryseobacterium sp.]